MKQEENMKLYRTEKYKADIEVQKYISEFVNADKFIGYCKQCTNYDRKWSCPSYDFDTADYWAQYDKLHIMGLKIIFNKDLSNDKYNLQKVMRECLYNERYALDSAVLSMEKRLNGRGLYAGSCIICRSVPCKRLVEDPCRHPEEMRYSLESLGADISSTCKELLGIELKWGEKNKLPEYYTLVCGVLHN